MREKFDGLVDQLLGGNVFLPDAIEILERSMIQRALIEHGGNQCAASKQLGIHRNTLQKKIAQYDLGNSRAHARKPPARAGRGAPRARKRKTA